MDVREAGDCGNARAVEMVRAERGGIVVVPGRGEERRGEERGGEGRGGKSIVHRFECWD